MRIYGSIDRQDGTAVEGWVTCPDYPDQKVALELVLNGAVVGRGAADRYRADLQSANLGDGVCAFSIPTPPFLPAMDIDRLVVRVQGSPLVFERQSTVRRSFDSVEKFERFGGLWIDEPDFMDMLGIRHRTGALSDAQCEQLVRFARDGYLILPGAVSAELIDRVNADIDRVWSKPPPGIQVETFEPDGVMRRTVPKRALRNGRTKLLDLHAYSVAARAAIANEATIGFLTALFASTPKAFQSLTFWNGSQQAMRKDTAYVKVEPEPMQLAASWLALEDITEGSGELEYFVGSHRAPHYLFGGAHKWMENHPEESESYLLSIQADAERYQHRRGRFLAQAGDVLIWHADLAHGGSTIAKSGRSRRSLVAHYTAEHNEPFYRRDRRWATVTENGCEFQSEFGPVPSAGDNADGKRPSSRRSRR